ncbi:10811_t:CDS:2, partial [Funneliformis geosporum]
QDIMGISKNFARLKCMEYKFIVSIMSWTKFLSLPFSGVYYFKQEFMFDCPTITLLTSKALPKFLDNLWRIREIISSSAESITSYIENMRESDDDSNDTDPVTISPKKQRRQK